MPHRRRVRESRDDRRGPLNDGSSVIPTAVPRPDDDRAWRCQLWRTEHSFIGILEFFMHHFCRQTHATDAPRLRPIKMTVNPSVLMTSATLVLSVALASCEGRRPEPTGACLELFDAIGDGNVAAVRTLLSDGTDPNCGWSTDGDSPLHLAAATGNVEIISLLCDAGASINAGSPDPRGFTPLHWAVQKNEIESVRALIARGAVVNTECYWDEGPVFDTPLLAALNHHAIDHRVVEGTTVRNVVLEILLEAGADPNYRASEDGVDVGCLPLYNAVLHCLPEEVEPLLAAGADPKLVAKAGSDLVQTMNSAMTGPLRGMVWAPDVKLKMIEEAMRKSP